MNSTKTPRNTHVNLPSLQSISGDPLALAKVEHGTVHWSETKDQEWNTGYRLGKAGWRIDGEGIEFFTDLHGICPIYYAQSNDFFCCSPSLIAVARHINCRDLDEYALSSFLQMGFYCNDETPFKAIRVLPPGVRARWTNGKLELGKTAPFPAIIDSTYQQAIEGYTDLFRQSIQRLIDECDRPSAMLLSGGRDSRHILLELHAQNAAPKVTGTIQHLQRDESEVEIAKELSLRLGISHHIIPQDQITFADFLRTVLITNLEADEHNWFRSGFTWLARHTKTAMDGLAGERISGQFEHTIEIKNIRSAGNSVSSQTNGTVNIYTLLEEGKIDEATSATVSMWQKSPEIASKACSKFGIRFDPDAVYSNVHTALTQCISASNPLQQFYLRTRTRREVARAPVNMGSEVNDITFPYLDPDLVSYLTSLPSEITKRYGFHTDVIKHAYPDLADIPFANSSIQREKRGVRKRIIQVIHTRGGYALNSRRPWNALVRHPVWWQLAYFEALKKIQLIPRP